MKKILDIYISKQFIIFIFSGATAAFIHWYSRIILNKLISFSASIAAAYIIGMSVAFVLNKFFVFPNSTRSITRQARDFIVINLVFFPIVYLLSTCLDGLFQQFLPVEYSQSIAHGIGVSVPTVVSFFIYKLFSFKDVQNGE